MVWQLFIDQEQDNNSIISEPWTVRTSERNLKTALYHIFGQLWNDWQLFKPFAAGYEDAMQASKLEHSAYICKNILLLQQNFTLLQMFVKT